MQGRDSYRLDPATSIQEQKYAVYRTLPVLKTGTVFADSLNNSTFQFSFQDMVRLLDFLFVRRSFLGVRQKISQNPILTTYDDKIRL